MFGLPLTVFLILAFLILVGVAIFNVLYPEFEDELPLPEAEDENEIVGEKHEQKAEDASQSRGKSGAKNKKKRKK